MSYDDFLKQLKEDHKTTAKMAIKRLYLLLKEEDPNLSKEDMYDRILKDCLVIWARATVIENMPDELKDSGRQEAGRRGAEAKKKLLRVTNDGNVARDAPANSNLFEQKQIESQTLEQGSKKRDNTSSTIVDKKVDDYPISNMDDPASSSHNEGLTPFEFSLLVQDVLGYLMPIIPKKGHEEDQMWFSGVLDKSSDTPFRLETDEDESVIFSFLGQVRDRLLYHVSDIRERHIPPIMDWILKACDLNKDVGIDDTCQLTLPDIQIKHADRVFRLYVKSLHDKAVYRSEESLTLKRVLPEALESI